MSDVLIGAAAVYGSTAIMVAAMAFVAAATDDKRWPDSPKMIPIVATVYVLLSLAIGVFYPAAFTFVLCELVRDKLRSINQ